VKLFVVKRHPARGLREISRFFGKPLHVGGFGSARIAEAESTIPAKNKSYDFEKFRPTSLLSSRYGFA
jgi:hypothetical protein